MGRSPPSKTVTTHSGRELVPELVEFLQNALIDLPVAPTKYDPATGQ